MAQQPSPSTTRCHAVQSLATPSCVGLGTAADVVEAGVVDVVVAGAPDVVDGTPVSTMVVDIVTAGVTCLSAKDMATCRRLALTDVLRLSDAVAVPSL